MSFSNVNFYTLLDQIRSSCKKCNYWPSGRNRTTALRFQCSALTELQSPVAEEHPNIEKKTLLRLVYPQGISLLEKNDIFPRLSIFVFTPWKH